jgi:A/G-specific adenine glycosylase
LTVSEFDAAALLARATQLHPDLPARLVAWQRAQGRHHLPWQQTRDPYRVWLSEIMLQQTQVSTVLGYYERFLARFPSVVDLANADLDDVLTLWSGLGYYSRARNLHRCAQAVRDVHGGRFPGNASELEQLPGIGPSTAAAIAAFCFGERISIMDGNVRRVLSRVLGWEGDLSVRAHERALTDAAQRLVPDRSDDMVSYTQGLMDLGATLCTPRKPACLTCPWSDLCEGRRSGEPERLPVKTKKLKRSQRESWCLWLQQGDAVWLFTRSSNKAPSSPDIITAANRLGGRGLSSSPLCCFRIWANQASACLKKPLKRLRQCSSSEDNSAANMPHRHSLSS